MSEHIILFSVFEKRLQFNFWEIIHLIERDIAASS